MLGLRFLPFGSANVHVAGIRKLKHHENGCFMSQMSQWVMSHESMSQWVRSEKIKDSVETIKLSITFTYYVYLLHYCLHMQGRFLTWNLYSSRNDPDPEMIPNPDMIPKSTPKWSPFLFTATPKWSPINSWNGTCISSRNYYKSVAAFTFLNCV